MEDETWEVAVVGGGPAGLAAAQWLARYRRRVLLIDGNDPRNAVTWAVHGYLGVPDPSPAELRRIGRAQAADAGARLEAGEVARIEGEIDAFRLHLSDGRAVSARRVLLATGLRDITPEVPGFDAFYGRSIWHCPDCDGPSVTGRKVGVIGWGKGIARFCMWLLTWTDDLVVLTHSHPHGMDDAAWAALGRFGIRLRGEAIVALEGDERTGAVARVRFHDGTAEDVDGLFFHIACGPGSPLPAELGCALAEGNEDEGILAISSEHETSVPGVFAAGDITPGSRLALRAASEGVRAAIGLHRSLLPPERRVR